LEPEGDEAARGRWMWLGVGSLLLVLVLFKYLGFLAGIANAGLAHLSFKARFQPPHWPAFIGISYLSFQAISYLLDIYFRTIKREPRLDRLALHLCLFPKAIQGPIERAEPLIPQLAGPRPFCYEDFRAGLLLLAWGLFKKAVIADRLAWYVDLAFKDPQACQGPGMLLAVYAFALQLFCDFSGYTDMALGAARLLGIRLTQNFNAPFAATSMQDFWKRWHITLSSWILDYVFLPLQVMFRGLGDAGSALAIFLAFLAMGIWHGATWGFVAFGLIQGWYMMAGLLYRPYKKRLHKFLGLGKQPWFKAWQVLVTFHLVCFSFVFFKVASPAEGWAVVSRCFMGWEAALAQIWGDESWWKAAASAGRTLDLAILGLALAALLGVALLKGKIRLEAQPAPLRWAFYYSLGLFLLFGGLFFAEKQFIYSQF
jgi:D-alanyl-lipoteichoic acid acyltransferase DltB (MBOAT superfamily)